MFDDEYSRTFGASARVVTRDSQYERTDPIVMKRALLAAGAALALLTAPAGATAKPAKTDRTNAAKECKAERGSTAATREAFRAKYGTNKNGKNAYGKCVSARSKAEEAQRKNAAKNAAKECKAERAADPAAFGDKYGTNKKGKNAFGKCVSSKAKEHKAKEDAEDAEEAEARKSAANECAAERTTLGRERVRGQVRHEREQAQRLRQVRLEDGQGLIEPRCGAG